ncbi:MAG: Hsp20/alpha crystallin family protein [Gammaproteobacteria bacterium]
MQMYRPLGLLGEFQREIGQLFDNRDDASVVTNDWVPAVDVREDNDRFVIRADLPGVDPKNIDMTMENGTLTLRGKREEEKDASGKGWHRIERVSGSFYRRFGLPDSADADRIDAKSENGVLEVTIPKHARVKPRKIEVAHQA